MKAVLNGEYSGSGGKQHISIKGDLSVEGLNVEALLGRISQLEDHVVNLEIIVSRLQEQILRTNIKELAKALEQLKVEEAVSEPVVAPSQEEVKPVASTSKKKSA